MFQAERAPGNATRSQWAAALRNRKRDARGWHPWGPPRVRYEWRPSHGGAGVVVHEEVVAQRRPYAGRRPQAPDPRVPAMGRQGHKLHHHLMASCEDEASR